MAGNRVSMKDERVRFYAAVAIFDSAQNLLEEAAVGDTGACYTKLVCRYISRAVLRSDPRRNAFEVVGVGSANVNGSWEIDAGVKIDEVASAFGLFTGLELQH